MPDWLLIALFVLLGGAGLVQLGLPHLAARLVERRLSEGGGTVAVELAAWPAVRLLAGNGTRLRVRGSQLRLVATPQDSSGLGALDGFREVDVELADSVVGPFEVRRFALRRDGDASYELTTVARTSGAELLTRAGSGLGIAGSGLLGAIAQQTPIAGEIFDVEVGAELVSEQGGMRIVSGDGKVGGYPIGPIAQIIAAAIGRQLEVSP